MRYTEARMAHAAHALTDDLDKLADSASVRFFVRNYDETENEPTVLPARFPNVLVNGGTGIAVGMASSIPPHNMAEVINATLALIDNPGLDTDALMQHIPGPDFPTGGVIQGRAAIREAYLTGRGSIRVAGVHNIETGRSGRESIVFTEIPYAVNKTTLLEAMADKVKAGLIENVAGIRDESSKDGIRVVIEVKRDGDANLVLNQLKKHSSLFTSFGYNAVCLSPNRPPGPLGLVAILSDFIAFRRQVIRERTIHLLNDTREKLNRQVGLFAARSQVDDVVRIIRGSKDRDAARAALMDMEFPTAGDLGPLLFQVDPDAEVPPLFRLSEFQANEVLSLRLASLTGLELERIAGKVGELVAEIAGYEAILNSAEVLDGVMRQELVEVREKFSSPRRTRIESAGPEDISDDDLIEQKPIVLTLTRGGYVKITPLDAYREQSRGGKGKSGMDTKDDDVVIRTLVCNTRTQLIFFTTRGIAHTLKAYRLHEAAANAKGRPIVNWVPHRSSEGESIATVMALPDAGDGPESKFMMFVTDRGDVRRNAASAFASVNRGGKIAMKLEDENGRPTARLIDVLMCSAGDDIVLATRKGKAARFDVEDVRVMTSRDSTGVKGITLGPDDAVIGASIIRHFEATPAEREAYADGGTTSWKDDAGVEQRLELDAARMEEMRAAEQMLLTVTASGFGKRFSTHEFRTTSRGAQGVWAGTFSAYTGDLVGCFPVEETDGLVLVTNGGQTIRTRVKEIRVAGRTTRGVRLFDLADGQFIVDVARVAGEE
jgi:DNA gyrase subunit A